MSELRHRRQQQIRAFWSCNGFLSPIVPNPNMPLPPPPAPITHAIPIQHVFQAVGPNVPAAVALPIYGQFRNGGRLMHSHSRVFEFQRVEDERLINTGETFDNMNISNGDEQVQTQYNFECEQEMKVSYGESPSSPRGSSTVNSSDSSDQLNNMPLGFSAARYAGDGSSNDSSPAFCTPSTSKANVPFVNDVPVFNSDGTVTVSQSKYNELTRLALRGSEIAERLAYTHRNRPCFKKIDSLCARMKQDLIRPDGVLPNINSQGIAWAIKDLIFVFTRIISAWIIIKGYVFNTPEGLNKVKAALCPDFVSRFLVWQDATYDFAESLVRSFVSLDNLVQSQKTAHQKAPENLDNNNFSSPPKTNHSANNPLFDDKFDYLENHVETLRPASGTHLNNNYLYTMVKDSENSQREATVNGTYLKEGTYNPIKKDAFRSEYSSNTPEKSSQHSVSIMNRSNTAVVANLETEICNTLTIQEHETNGQILEASHEVLNNYFDEELYQRLATGEIDIPMVEQYLRERLPAEWVDYGIRMFWRTFAERVLQVKRESTDSVDNQNNSLNILPLMVDRLMAMRSSDLFFKLQFTKNYFPKFIAKYEEKLIDLRTVVLKSQVNKYSHVFEIVHDVRRISYFAKIYLEFNLDADLVKAINEFEIEFDNLLHDEPFNLYKYEHLTGDPQESLFL